MTQPLLSPSPMNLGDVLTSTFNVYKRRFGLFVALGAIPAAATGIMLAIFWIAVFPKILDLFTSMLVSWVYSYPSDFSYWTGSILVSTLVYLTAIFVVSLIQFRVQAMIAVAASDLMQGGNPSFADLYPRTQGVMAGTVTIALLVTGGFAVATFAPLAPLWMASGGGSNYVAMLLAVFAITVGLSLLTFYLLARLWYVIPVLALEQKPAGQTFTQALNLSKNSFWRILGHALLLNFLISIPVSAVSQAMSLTSPLETEMDSGLSHGTMVLLTTIVLPAWYAFALPFQTTFQSVMYADQVQRNSMPQPAAHGGMHLHGGPTQPFHQTPPPTQPGHTGSGQPVTGYPEPQGQTGWHGNPTGQVHQPPVPTPQPGTAPNQTPDAFRSYPHQAGPPTESQPDPSFEPPSGFGEPLPPSGNGRPTA